jgi:hypothetical protein
MENKRITPRQLAPFDNKLAILTNKNLKGETYYFEPLQGILDDLADAIVDLQKRVSKLEMVKREDWQWHGIPGHFCASGRCLFRLCTDVGNYRISTVGAMYDENQKLMEIGLNRHYETMVFLIKNGEVTDWSEIDFDRVYCGKVKVSNKEFDELASKMHIKMCEKYSKL